MRIRSSLLVMMLLFAASVNAQQWTAFRNDNARSGISDKAIDAARLELAWQWNSELPPDPAWDGPARWDAFNRIRDLPAMRQYDACFHPVSDGQAVYFGSSSQDTLTALNLDDGAERWSFVAGGPIRLAPTIDGDKILFGCDDGNAYCLERKTGQLIWKFSPSKDQAARQRRLINNDRLISFYPVRTGITVRDGLACFGASLLPWRESFLCAIDVNTGKPDKTSNTFVVKHENATLEGSLLVADNRLIVPQGRVAPLLFDRTNGKSLGNLPGGGGVTIVLTESGEVVRAEGGGAARAGQVGVFKDKERVASFPRGRSIVVREDHFYVIDGQKLFAASRPTNELRWQREVDEPLELVMAGDTLFVGGRDHVTAVNSQNGQVVWSAETEGRVFGLAIAGNHLIASTDSGRLYIYSRTSDKDWAADSKDQKTGWKSPRVARVRSQSLMHRWVFHRSAMETSDKNDNRITRFKDVLVHDQSGDTHLRLSGEANALQIGDSETVEAIELKDSMFPVQEAAAQELPNQAISVESWVRVDQPTEWGGIVGCIQDDGSTEFGWLLGYRSDRFCLAIAGGGNGLTYLTANDSFSPGNWYHIVGTYDGREMRLFVNGSLAASSTDESGPISYAPIRHFTVGAYKDANESFPLDGALHEIRIYSTPLDATTIANHFAAKAKEFGVGNADNTTGSDMVTWGPVTRFVGPGEVEISYGTKAECASVVDLITEDGVKRFAVRPLTKEHRVVVSGLPHHRELQFQIRDGDTETASLSESYGIDTHFAWAQTADEAATGWTADLIQKSPNPRGLALVLGADQAEQAVRLATESQFSVVLVVEDENVAAKIRNKWWLNPNLRYGRELCATGTPVDQLPAACASVVVSKQNDDQARRLVRPAGGILHDGKSVVWQRDPVEGSGVWTHMYGQADNSAYGGEHLSNATTRQDLLTQWIGRPGPRYKTDRQNRKPSPLAAGGRLFLQGQQRIIALDSFSGTVLWSVESPSVMRWNVPHDCSNWCADEEGVYVAAKNRAWFMDGRTGRVVRQFGLPIKQDHSKEKSWGFIARYNDQLLGTVVATPAIFTEWWGNTQWFDSTDGDDTHVVASDSLFAMDHKTGNVQWSYDGLILHPTITVMDDQVYFIEDKTPDHQNMAGRRISLEAGQRHEIVCLDIVTGKIKWQRPIAFFAGHVASLYLAGGGKADQRSLVLVASESTKQEFTVQTLNPKTGDPLWNRTVAWEANHHGKHISRPAIQGELVYLRPEVLDLSDGTTIHRGFPGGHGCSSYTLSNNGLFSRLGETTWWNVREDKVSRFSRIRTDCWISVVPAQGMLLSAEGGGGCSCGTWLETSLGFLPRSLDLKRPEK